MFPRRESPVIDKDSGPESDTLTHVEAWRMEQLHRASYDESSAWMLALSPHVDLHEAVELVVKRHCPPSQALLILYETESLVGL
jgi:hypothetical protein